MHPSAGGIGHLYKCVNIIAFGLSGNLLGKSSSFGFLCVMSICNFGCFPFLASRRDGSDCTSSWSLLTFCFRSGTEVQAFRK